MDTLNTGPTTPLVAEKCGRSDCTAAATVRTVMKSQSGRTRQMRGCDAHAAGHQVVADQLGFTVTSTEAIATAGVSA